MKMICPTVYDSLSASVETKLKHLVSRGIPAIHFVGAVQAKAHGVALIEAVRLSCPLGKHLHSDSAFSTLTSSDVVRQIVRRDLLIEAIRQHLLRAEHPALLCRRLALGGLGGRLARFARKVVGRISNAAETAAI